MRLIVDGRPISYEPGDSLLIALLRADIQPTGGGCLCLGGDCHNCLATVDGVSYVRTCQTAAKPGLVVQRHHLQKYPPLPQGTLPQENQARPAEPPAIYFATSSSSAAASRGKRPLPKRKRQAKR